MFKVFSCVMGLAMIFVSVCMMSQWNVTMSHMGLAAIDPASSVIWGIAELVSSICLGILVYHYQMEAFKEGGYLEA